MTCLAENVAFPYSIAWNRCGVCLLPQPALSAGPGSRRSVSVLGQFLRYDISTASVQTGTDIWPAHCIFGAHVAISARVYHHDCPFGGYVPRRKPRADFGDFAGDGTRGLASIS